MTNVNQFFSEYSPYLEEIRKRIYFLAVSFLLVFVIGFFASGYIVKFLVGFFDINDVLITITSPFQFINLAVNIGLLSAIIIIFPLIIYFIFSFLKSALTLKERHIFIFTIPVSIFLFILGFSLGFFIMYYTLTVLAKINFNLGIANMWDISFFLSQVFLTASLLGIIFQFPVVLTVLIRIGLLGVESLKKKRRIIIAIAFIATALLPPTDGVSLLIMVLPIILLFEITLLINRRQPRKVAV